MYKCEKAIKLDKLESMYMEIADTVVHKIVKLPFRTIHASPLLKNMGSLNMFIPCYDSTLLIFPLPS